MNKPTLYVALQGPLLIPSDKPHPYLEAGIAEYAKSFLSWAKEHFGVQVLTDDSLRKVHTLTEHLSLPPDAALPRGFDFNKTDVMDPASNFYWVDSALIPSEISWLYEHKLQDRLLTVDPAVGVTPEHRRILTHLAGLRK
jgi:hypothetical protein